MELRDGLLEVREDEEQEGRDEDCAEYPDPWFEHGDHEDYCENRHDHDTGSCSAEIPSAAFGTLEFIFAEFSVTVPAASRCHGKSERIVSLLSS